MRKTAKMKDKNFSCRGTRYNTLNVGERRGDQEIFRAVGAVGTFTGVPS